MVRYIGLEGHSIPRASHPSHLGFTSLARSLASGHRYVTSVVGWLLSGASEPTSLHQWRTSVPLSNLMAVKLY
jgi:hypothetical protein